MCRNLGEIDLSFQYLKCEDDRKEVDNKQSNPNKCKYKTILKTVRSMSQICGVNFHGKCT